MRVGNWLEGSRIPFVTVVRFIYFWCFWEREDVHSWFDDEGSQ